MEFLSACNQMAAEVEESISDLVGTPEGGKIVRMGADRTPTTLIYQVAEDSVLHFLEENPLCKLFISEEAGKVEFKGEKGTIFLDPVDDTFNLVAGIPFYTLSIAYAENGKIQQAFVRDLSSGETFAAIRGKFARCNDKPIRVSGVTNLDECAMSIYGRKFDPTHVMQLGQKIRRWRLFGASALELCYVGCGRIDGFVDLRDTLRVTNAAAGMLVCTESGGNVSDLNGDAIQFPNEVIIGRSIIATNGAVHHKVIEYLR